MNGAPDRALHGDAHAAALARAYRAVRGRTDTLVRGLTPEDCQVQSMAEASPVKWHLAHTSWFFETLVLEEFSAAAGFAFRPFREPFRVLFNSYYNGIGAAHARPERGLLSRPSLEEVLRYRADVDVRVGELLAAPGLGQRLPSALERIELGLHHEEQHQELILTDLKHHFSRNPLQPALRAPLEAGAARAAPMDFVPCAGGLCEAGHAGGSFSFDNERPRHRVWLEPFEIGNRLVTNGEFRAFIEEGGYRRPELWLSDGWDAVRREDWHAPLYWHRDGSCYTLAGRRDLAPAEPVCHVSYFEADAYARWAGARLATEFEWEAAAQGLAPAAQGGNFLDSGRFHPRAAPAPGAGVVAPAQLLGDAWEWTASAYLPYPGFRAASGAPGEYNGKFMVNQMVLRGGSCATPAAHIRTSYRNFFPPGARWQFSGIRLAR